MGVGAGQMSRVDAAWIAVRKADGRAKGAVMASDAFFPFPDAIEVAADAGVTAVVLPFVMTASFAVVIVIARHRREVSMMPATATSQVLVVLACAPFAAFGSVSRGDWAILAALGVGQMGLGLALLTIGARLIPPAQVAVISLLEIVLGPLGRCPIGGERRVGRHGHARVAGSSEPFTPERRQARRGRARCEGG